MLAEYSLIWLRFIFCSIDSSDAGMAYTWPRINLFYSKTILVR